MPCAIIAAQAAELNVRQAQLENRGTVIGTLRARLAVLRRAGLGRRRKKERTVDQLELALEEIEAAKA